MDLQKIVDAMETNCPNCQGAGFVPEIDEKTFEYTGEKTKCSACHGDGKDLTWEGQQLVEIIRRYL